MAKPFISPLSPQGFRALLSSSSPHSRVVPIDASWYMPNTPHNGKDKFLNEERIANSGFFDLDAVALPDSPYPHMLPPWEIFNKAVQDLGLTKTDKLVFYDKSGVFSSPRAAWTFSLFGHGKLYLLDHFPSYKKHDYPLDTKKVTSIATPLEVETDPHDHHHHTETYELITKDQFQENFDDQVIGFDELLALVKSGKLEKHFVTFDARSKERFDGTAPEPRPGLPSGHIPGAHSLPFPKVLKEDGTYKSKEELLKIFKEDYKLDLTDPTLGGKFGVVVMCGTGVTAVILRLAITSVIGADIPIKVYDGSWTEWAQRAPPEYIVKSPKV